MGGAASNQHLIRDSQPIPPELQQWENLPSIGGEGESNGNEDYLSWDFDIWKLEGEGLLVLTMHIARDFNFPKLFCFKTDIWCHFIWEVQRLMGLSINPYHNFRHVIDVAQSCSCVVKEFSASYCLNEFDTFALIVSAIIHDLEHPGTNNLYQVNAATPLAMRYNDISVLENHHCAKAFELFTHPNCDITHSFATDKKKFLRKTIIALVLNTDMTQHFSLRAELDELATRVVVDSVPVKMNDKDTLIVLKSILHTCDISNPAKNWDCSKRWSDLVIEEFFRQGDREKLEGLPVSMNCDRTTTFQDELSLNFTDFIVAPFFFSMAKLLPKMLRVCKVLEVNRNIWDDIYTKRADALYPDETERKVVLDKWVARKAAFTEKLTELEGQINPAWTSAIDNAPV